MQKFVFGIKYQVLLRLPSMLRFAPKTKHYGLEYNE